MIVSRRPSVPETTAPAVLKSNRAGFELPPGYIYSDWKPVAAPLPEGVEPDDLLIPDFLRRGE